MPSFTKGVVDDDAQLTSITLAGAASTKVSAMGKLTQSLTPVAVAATTSAEQTFTVPGLLVGDFVDIAAPSATAGVFPTTARVSATNTLAITFANVTAGSLTPAAGAYQIQIMR